MKDDVKITLKEPPGNTGIPTRQKLPFVAEKDSDLFFRQVILLLIREFDTRRKKYVPTENFQIFYHGKGWSFQRHEKDGYKPQTGELGLVSNSCLVELDRIIAHDPTIVSDFIRKAADTMESQLSQKLLDTMGSAAKESGNEISIPKGGSFADAFLEMVKGITKILGWIGSSIIAEALIAGLDDGNDALRFALASALLDRYAGSIVAVSDEQAPFLYAFLKACLLKNQTDLAKRVVTLYFASFADKKGNVTRVGVDGIQAFRYIQSLGPEEYRPQDWRPANPSHLLPVLLYFGAKLNFGEIWDLRALDRISSVFFIPVNYRDFGCNVIDQGMNYTQQMGFGVWSLSGFIKELERGITERFSADTRGFSKEGAALCTVASLLFPDRLPLVLECALQ